MRIKSVVHCPRLVYTVQLVFVQINSLCSSYGLDLFSINDGIFTHWSPINIVGYPRNNDERQKFTMEIVFRYIHRCMEALQDIRRYSHRMPSNLVGIVPKDSLHLIVHTHLD